MGQTEEQTGLTYRRKCPKVQLQAEEVEWMSGEVLREVRRKRRLWKKARNGLGREEYDLAAKRVKNLIRNAKRSLEKKLATDKYQNSKPFFNYVKKKTSSKVAVGPLINRQGEMVSSEADIAEELNTYF